MKFFIFSIIAIIFFVFMSCSTNAKDINGEYLNTNKNAFVDKVKFSKKYVTISAGKNLGLSFSVNAPYRFKEKNIIDITDPNKGTVIFLIINKTTIKSETFGYQGLYIKK